MRYRFIAGAAAAGLATSLLTSCAAAAPATSTPAAEVAAVDIATGELFDSSFVHTIEVEFDEADYDAIIAAYVQSGDKEWMSATVTIDGVVFENVGLRLKGNSSLRGIAETAGDGSASAEEPASIPWLIRLDYYVDGQQFDGRTELVVRGNNSETALNEAVALELIGMAGLATQEAIAVRFSVNGSEEVLRLVIESPDDEEWSEDTFGEDGITYEAETEGDYSYRGDDPAAYDNVFSQQSDTPGSDEDNLEPVIDLLEFVETATDAEFDAQLGEYLDVDAFATYLAVQELIDNFDDIDGPGNNSYLRWDAATDLITVVAWDHNLALGVSNGRGGEPLGAGGGNPPAGVGPVGGPVGGAGGGQGGPRDKVNPLAVRFMASDTFSAMYETALAELRASLYESGAAQSVLDEWVEVLTEGASDLVDSATIEQEAASVATYW
jgi:spore coat protein CotH